MLLSEQKISPFIKMILVGYSGRGKSTAIAALGVPAPGFEPYQLRVLDADGKDGKFAEVVLRMLASRVKDGSLTEKQAEEAKRNYDICSMREATGVVELSEQGIRRPAIGVVGTPTAWKVALRQLKEWDKSGWTNRHILVGDSFTYITKAIAKYTQALANKTNQELTGRDYLAPQQVIQDFLTIFTDLPCHAILTGHHEPLDIYLKSDRVLTTDKGVTEPQEDLVESTMALISLGSKGRVHIPCQFNHMLVVALEGSNNRRIFTEPKDGIMPKTPFYGLAEKSYSIRDGLPKYFMLGN